MASSRRHYTVKGLDFRARQLELEGDGGRELLLDRLQALDHQDFGGPEPQVEGLAGAREGVEGALRLGSRRLKFLGR